MSVITAKVAGVDRTSFILKSRPPNWEDILNTRGTGTITFEVAYADLASFRPQDGQTVQVIEDGTVRFGGFLVEPGLTDLIDEEIVIFDCGMKDNNSIADRRVVTAEYDDEPFEDIVADILFPSGKNDGLKGEGITDGGVATGPNLTIAFPTIYVVEALNDLAVAVGGWWWNIGHDKDMDFADRTSLSAPGPLTGANTLKKTPNLRPVLEKYRNIEYVLAGNDDFPIAAGYWASGEVSARAALEGTTGRYEHIEERQDIVDPVLAEELAEDLVERFGTVTKYFQCVTRDPGYKSGQEVDLTFPALDLSAEAFLIDGVNAQVHYTSEDGTDIQEIWYTVTAITGDPFGGWMEHFRKRQPPSQKRKIVPRPGLQFECDPGVLLHDPPAGPYDWFQGAASGALDSTPSAIGITHQLPGDGGWYVCARRGPVAVPRQTYVELYSISDSEGVATTPSHTAAWDELSASSLKQAMVIKPDNSLVAIIERDAGFDPIFILVNLLTQSKLGHVAATGLVDNNDSFEGAWVGDYVYIPEVGTGSVFVFDVSNAASPTLETEFVTSLGGATTVVPSSDGSYLFVSAGTENAIVALDISDPTNITEVDSATVTGSYNSFDLRGADDLIAAFERADGANIRYLILPVTVGGGAATFGTPIEANVALATATMEGWATIFDGSTAHTFRNKPAPSLTNAQRSHTFELNTAETAFTYTETFSYNHSISGANGPSKSYIGKRVIQTFGFNTDAQITYGVVDWVCTELETQWPLETGFGGTGFKTYDKGDILAGIVGGVLGRLGKGQDEAVLTADSTEATNARWERNNLWNVLEVDGDSAPYAVVDGDDVILAEPTSGEMTIDLPALADSLDRMLAVKNVGDGSWGVVVDPDSTEQIEGASTLALAGANDAAIFVAGLTQWDILATAGAGVGIAHSSLTGLTADDHAHYLLVDGTRAMTGNLEMGGFNVNDADLMKPKRLNINSSGGGAGAAGSIRLYGADDGAGNTEFMDIEAVGAMSILAKKAGTGTQRTLSVGVDGFQWAFATNGNFYPVGGGYNLGLQAAPVAILRLMNTGGVMFNDFAGVQQNGLVVSASDDVFIGDESLAGDVYIRTQFDGSHLFIETTGSGKATFAGQLEANNYFTILGDQSGDNFDVPILIKETRTSGGAAAGFGAGVGVYLQNDGGITLSYAGDFGIYWIDPTEVDEDSGFQISVMFGGVSTERLTLNHLGDLAIDNYLFSNGIVLGGGTFGLDDELLHYRADDGAGNWERAAWGWVGGLYSLDMEVLGTETLSDFRIRFGGTEFFRFSTGGHILPYDSGSTAQQLGTGGFPWHGLVLGNLKALWINDFGGTARSVLTVDASDHTYLSNVNLTDTIIRSGFGDHMRFEAAGEVLIGRAGAHAQVTLGLIVDQGNADDYVHAFESIGVTHGITTVIQTDSFGGIKKIANASGGLSLEGFTELAEAVQLWGTATTEDTTKSTAAIAPIMLRSSVKSGTDRATMTADANILVVRDHNLAQVIIEQDGEIHCNLSATITDHSGHVTEFDEFDDVALCTGLRGVMLGKTAPEYLRSFVEYARPVLEAGRVVTFNEDGHHFVALKALHALTLDTIIQVGGRVRDHDWRIRHLEAELAELKAGV